MSHTRVALQSVSGLSHGTDRKGNTFCQDRSNMPTWVAVVGLFLLLSIGQAWGEVGTGEKRAIVAAGFGYQIGPSSAIAVKVYDAGTGAILSDEVYELTVKESDGAEATRAPRIFAGGVGLGATDLSNFVLRVYDANTGVFQWEGQLNLVQSDRRGEGQVISAAMSRRATVTKVHGGVETATEQPVFLLRALDAATGLSVWEDEFTAVRDRIPRVHPVASQPIQSEGITIGSSHTFDFRIRMYDPSGQKVLWEDQLSRLDSDEGGQESFSDRAHLLPPWPNQPPEESAAELL